MYISKPLFCVLPLALKLHQELVLELFAWVRGFTCGLTPGGFCSFMGT